MEAILLLITYTNQNWLYKKLFDDKQLI